MKKKPTINERACSRCGKRYLPNSNYQKYCVECRLQVEKESSVKGRMVYVALHGEKVAEYQKEYRKSHLEQARETDGRFRRNHPDKRREGFKQWNLKNPGTGTERSKRWRSSNPDGAKKINVRQSAKRRALGFIPLNEPFEGCEGHHKDTEYVWYVPKWLHRSISHNVWTGKNMEKINAAVSEWLASDKKEKII